jgi:DHA2 family multidrug resistance protein
LTSAAALERDAEAHAEAETMLGAKLGIGDRIGRVLIRGEVTNKPWFAVSAVLLATLMTSFHTRYFSLALADLRGVWGLSFDEGAELNTIANALQLLVAPVIPLAAVTFGSRRVLMYNALLLAFTTFLTPFATGHLALFLLNGATAILLGCFVPATLATIFRNLPPSFWLLALSLYTFRLTLTLHSGGTLESLYIDYIGWQGMFWQTTLTALVVALLVAIGIPQEPIKTEMWDNSDKGAVAMFCVALTMLYAGLDEGNRLDWFESGEITALIGGALLLFACFIVWQYFTDRPFAHPRVMMRRGATLPMLIGVFFGFTNLATAYLIPNFLGTVQHQKSTQSGDILWVVTLAQIVLVPLSIYVIRRVDARLTVAFGLAAMMVSCWLGTFITHEWVGRDFLPVTLAMAVGSAFTFTSMMALAVANAKPADMLGVLAYAQIARVIAPTFATSVVTTLIRKREAIHSALLTPYLDPARPIVADALNAVGGRMSSLSSVVQREAYVLAYRDLYTFCFWMGAVALLFVMLMPPAPPNPLTPSGHDL